MLDLHFRRRAARPASLLARYSDQFGRIAGRNRAEMALLAAKQEAERTADFARAALVGAEAASRAKTEFLANMSHELRTPLNAIIGFSDMMLHGVPDRSLSQKHLEYVRDINDSGRHLLGIINDILDLAKIEAGRLELHETVVDLDRCIEACLGLLRQQSDAGGLRLRATLSNGCGLWADERKLKQILINLLSNAVKFTPEGGEIHLKAGVAPRDGVTISVSDSGVGIAREDIWKALATFTQVHGDLNRVHEGTGLGLPLSRALAELHGGSLTLESELGVGTTVTVRLPAARLRSPQPETPRSAAAAR